MPKRIMSRFFKTLMILAPMFSDVLWQLELQVIGCEFGRYLMIYKNYWNIHFWKSRSWTWPAMSMQVHEGKKYLHGRQQAFCLQLQWEQDFTPWNEPLVTTQKRKWWQELSCDKDMQAFTYSAAGHCTPSDDSLPFKTHCPLQFIQVFSFLSKSATLKIISISVEIQCNIMCDSSNNCTNPLNI